MTASLAPDGNGGRPDSSARSMAAQLTASWPDSDAVRATTILGNLVVFAEDLRMVGVPLGSGQLINLIEAFSVVDLGRRLEVYHAMRTSVVTRPEHIPLFDDRFATFWERLGMGTREARDRAAELLALVGIREPQARLDDHPHQFSGGMRQRVMIAIGLSLDPAVLIADEPTTALDVTTQAQILDLVQDLQERLGTAVVWVSHDLGVVAGIADRVVVMYSGEVVEQAPVDELYAAPRHPYTRGLLGALPVLGQRRSELATIAGLTPDPLSRPDG